MNNQALVELLSRKQQNLTCPAASMAALSSFANPVSILAWKPPDRAMNGRKHRMSIVSFQLK